MAGVKGRSGGARPNTGGARPGAGRKREPPVLIVPPQVQLECPKQPEPIEVAQPTAYEVPAQRKLEAAELQAKPPATADQPMPEDMLELLKQIALGRIDASPTQVKAAIAAVQYTHTKRGDGGKKEEVAEKAKAASKGRFAGRPAPLALVSGGG